MHTHSYILNEINRQDAGPAFPESPPKLLALVLFPEIAAARLTPAVRPGARGSGAPLFVFLAEDLGDQLTRASMPTSPASRPRPARHRTRRGTASRRRRWHPVDRLAAVPAGEECSTMDRDDFKNIGRLASVVIFLVAVLVYFF